MSDRAVAIPIRQTWLFTFSTSVTEPPTGNQVRFDGAYPYTAVSKVWVRNETTDGLDVHAFLMGLAIGSTLYLQDKDDHTKYAAFVTVAVPIDKTDYVELPVAWVANGAALVGQAIQFTYQGPTVNPTPAPPAPAPTTGSWMWPAAPSSGFGLHRVVVVDAGPAGEPLSLAQGKLRSGLDFPDGDPRDALMNDMIRAARQSWETQTGMALLTQTQTLLYDAVPPILELIVRPLASVQSVTLMLADGTQQALDPTAYVVDLAGSRIAFIDNAPANARFFQPWAITVTAGYDTPDKIPGDIIQALGVLVGYWSTLGRDLAAIDIVTEMPYGWDSLIAPYIPEVLP